MKRVARALLVAALFGAVAVAGQDMSSTAEVTPTPTPDAAASSTGVVPTPTPTPAQSSTGVTPTPTPAQSSTGVTPTPTPAMSSSASSSPSSVSSTGSVQPGAGSSSGGSEPFSTGAAPFTAGLCDLLTTANGFNNRDEKNEETALGAVIQAAILGTENTKNGVKVTGIVNEPTLKPYFDGSKNYHQNGPVRSPYAKSPSPNFITDTTAFNSLKSKLIAFFGQSAVLGCSAPGFPTYTLVGDDGKTYRQYDVHYNMNISGTEFGLFNKQIVDAAAYYGADTNAQNTILSKLALFGRTNIAGANSNEICHMDSCPCASDATGTNCDGINAASSIQASFVSLAVVAAGALFAMAL